VVLIRIRIEEETWLAFVYGNGIQKSSEGQSAVDELQLSVC
jgi:hypothetical protein